MCYCDKSVLAMSCGAQCRQSAGLARHGALQAAGLGMQAQLAQRLAQAAAQAPFYKQTLIEPKKKKHELKNGNKIGLRLFVERFKEFQND